MPSSLHQYNSETCHVQNACLNSSQQFSDTDNTNDQFSNSQTDIHNACDVLGNSHLPMSECIIMHETDST